VVPVPAVAEGRVAPAPVAAAVQVAVNMLVEYLVVTVWRKI
jgi:hypothetical protein